jgi:acetolactate synthase-1/2/3 large subunit
LNGAEVLVEMLIRYGTKVIFGLPGDTSEGFYDALHAESSRITHIMARDERSASFMADVYSRLTGKPGICEGPSGGGATYILPGVVEANESSVALIALTTDNPLGYEATGALTDLDQPQIFRSVTKWTTVVKDADMMPRFVRRAFRLATSGRPGAVHLSLPKDVLEADTIPNPDMHIEDACKIWPSYRTRSDPDAVSRAARKLLVAIRPVIIAGGGLVSSRAHDELLALAQLLSAPVATTINGKGSIGETNPLSLGVIGANGGRPYAGQVVTEADLILYIGSKINYVDTDSWRLPPLSNPPVILQIDVDPNVIGNNYPVDVGLCGDAKMVLGDLFEAIKNTQQALPDRDDWLDSIVKLKNNWLAEKYVNLNIDHPIHPRLIIDELQSILPEDAILVCDPGTPTPFLAATFELKRPGRWVVFPRAQGALGYAIPGVVGARLAAPDKPVVGLCGDGSFAISAGDLATVARIGGPTVIILFNNSCYGWIKALQKLNYGGRYYSVDFTEQIDYVQIAKGFGLEARRVNSADEIGPAFREALDCGKPYLLDVITAPEHEVVPPVAPWLRRLKEMQF